MDKFKMFEDMINLYLCDKEADIKSCDIEVNSFGSTILKIKYRISDDFAKENDLYYKNRIMKIMLKRSEEDESAPIISYADVK